jgi:hypothetical protein
LTSSWLCRDLKTFVVLVSTALCLLRVRYCILLPCEIRTNWRPHNPTHVLRSRHFKEWHILRKIWYYSLQYNWFQIFLGIYPFGRGISQNRWQISRYLPL